MRRAQVIRQSMRQKMGSRLIAAGAVLEMSGLELGRRVEEAAMVNPALELVEDALCPQCGAPLRDGRCRWCGPTAGPTPDRPDWFESGPPRTSAEDEGDMMGALESPVGLQEHLRQQARTVVSGGDYLIADYLIANVNDRGLFDGKTSEAAEALGVPVERVEAVLGKIQTLDPPGVGGRSPQECLLIQLRSLAEDGRAHPQAELIVRDHWRALASHQYSAIARALRCTPEEVDEAVSFIRANLDPYPGRQYRPFWQSQPGNPEIAGRPDILLRRELDEYQVEVAELDIEVRLSEAYARLRSTAIRATRDFSTPEGRVALDSLRRAEWFLQSLQMRRDTLRAVAEAVVIAQRGFLDTGSEESLKPLTRAQVASRVGKHESTVSRAIAGKFVLLPNGRMVPFEKFFAPAASPKSVIRELIERETPDNPLTDEQLGQALAARGFRLARRTVTKYRLALKLPSSDQRGRR